MIRRTITHLLWVGMWMALGLGCLRPAQAQATIQADVVWLIDTSGSMYDKMDAVKSLITQFHLPLAGAGVDARYALVEFGGTSGNADTQATAALVQNLVEFDALVAPGSPFDFLSVMPQVGATEKGSLAVALALAYVSFRPEAAINLILVTDEDDDTDFTEDHPLNLTGPYPKLQIVDGMLTETGALFNFIGVFNDTYAQNPAYDGIQFNTQNTYSVLAANHGGAGFDILQLLNNPETFFNHFIQTKIEELTPEVPEPASALVLVIGAALMMRRRRDRLVATG